MLPGFSSTNPTLPSSISQSSRNGATTTSSLPPKPTPPPLFIKSSTPSHSQSLLPPSPPLSNRELSLPPPQPSLVASTSSLQPISKQPFKKRKPPSLPPVFPSSVRCQRSNSTGSSHSSSSSSTKDDYWDFLCRPTKYSVDDGPFEPRKRRREDEECVASSRGSNVGTGVMRTSWSLSTTLVTDDWVSLCRVSSQQDEEVDLPLPGTIGYQVMLDNMQKLCDMAPP
ncbi:hypothetical protein P7C70_g192, partial [Phenoliferia sp. Uapishka_3]